MSAPDDIEPAHAAAAKFKDLHDRIMESATKHFCGAFLVVPPTGDAKDLILYSGSDPAVFWGLLKTTAELALNDLAQEEARRMSGYGMR